MGKFVRPANRRSHNVTFFLSGHKIDLGLSVRPDDDPDFPGKVFEIFYHDPKEGSPFGSTIRATCSLISRALQHGDTVEGIIDGTPGELSFEPSGPVRMQDLEGARTVGSVISPINLILQTILWANSGFGPIKFTA